MLGLEVAGFFAIILLQPTAADFWIELVLLVPLLVRFWRHGLRLGAEP